MVIYILEKRLYFYTRFLCAAFHIFRIVFVAHRILFGNLVPVYFHVQRCINNVVVYL